MFVYMNDARLNLKFKDRHPHGLLIGRTCFGKLLSNGTVMLGLGTDDVEIEIVASREWTEDFICKLRYALDEQIEAEPELPLQASISSPHQAETAKI
jgi:hypothetical protein